MKAFAARFIFAAGAVTLAAGLQSASGAPFGAKPPFVLAACMWLAAEYGAAAMPAAVFAGGIADAVSGMPAFCSPAMLLAASAAALLARGSLPRRPAAAGAVLCGCAAPAAGCWAWLWTGCDVPVAASAAAGAAAGAAAFWAMSRVCDAFALHPDAASPGPAGAMEEEEEPAR